jgi:anti-sigma regulatory factor (Ser/Thr protein kinase)
MCPNATGRFEGDSGSPAKARALVRQVLAAWDCDDLDDVASLLTTEVVANAVRYAADQIALRVSLDDEVVRVEVRDSNPHLPKGRRVARGATSGRGLLVVESLAQRWGAQREETGKVVWFELATAGNSTEGSEHKPS